MIAPGMDQNSIWYMQIITSVVFNKKKINPIFIRMDTDTLWYIEQLNMQHVTSNKF